MLLPPLLGTKPYRKLLLSGVAAPAPAEGVTLESARLQWPEAGLAPATAWGVRVTVDEELTLLEEALRRLKVEYDVYFGGGAKRPPNDTEWRVNRILRKYSDGHRMNFSQRFRYNTLAQRYAVYSDLWRQKLKIKEEGFRRPQDALLAIQGLRTEQELEAAHALHEQTRSEAEGVAFSVHCSDLQKEQEKVRALFHVLSDARGKLGESASGSFESFQKFLERKTAQIRRDYGCHSVEYAVEVEGGQVRLKAKPRV